MTQRILLVEDEESISEPLSAHLAREGFNAVIAPTVQAARDSFQALAPDLVLLDVMLPDGDGKDLCRELRTRSDVPIVMLTARG
ncbi:MAG: response regulator transcription factor, partial [Actinobacteria bacterium]